MSNEVNPTIAGFLGLHKAYTKALADGLTGDDVFVLNGVEWLVSFAYYTLEYTLMTSATIAQYAHRHKLKLERPKKEEDKA